MNHHLPNEAGVTLVEFLIVISLIAILAVLLIPSASSALSSGRNIQCMANLKTIGQALSVYIGENNNQVPPPYIGINRSSLPSDPPWDLRVWTVRLHVLGYIDNPDVFYCPEESPKNFSIAEKVVVPPSSDLKKLMRTYGMRQWWFGNDFVSMASDPKSIALIKEPSKFYIVADSFWTAWKTQGYNLQPGNINQRIHLRHNGRANLLFLDGHVESQNSGYFAALHELNQQGLYSGGDPVKGRVGHIHYTEPSSQ